MSDSPNSSSQNSTNQEQEVELILIGSINEWPPNTRKVIRTKHEAVLVINIGSEVLAVSNTCPHAGGQLNYGVEADGVLECPLHYWPFDLRTGKLTGMPPYYDECLNTYLVRQMGDALFLEVPLRI